MNRTILAVCATLTMAACSQEFTRYDAEPGALPPLYRSITDERSQFAIGFDAIAAGDYAAAEAPLTAHLQAAPDDPYALLAMGAVMERTDRAAEAMPYYRNAAIHGANAPLGQTPTPDATTVPDARTIRDVAKFNMARLR